MIRLKSGQINLQIDPVMGASITRLCVDGLEILRKAPHAYTSVLQTGFYPLLPFCNRMGGAFTFDGKSIDLVQNVADCEHPLHGHGWQKQWHVDEVSPRACVLSYEHSHEDGVNDGWLWHYVAKISYVITQTTLVITLSVKNLSDADMPIGLGFHPFFKRSDQSKIKCQIDGVWLNDEQNLPKIWRKHDAIKNLNIDDIRHTDSCYTGFSGRVAIFEHNTQIVRINASAECQFLHIYAPQGEDFFCLEPMTHRPDPFGKGGNGLKRLGSNETDHVSMQLDFGIHD